MLAIRFFIYAVFYICPVVGLNCKEFLDDTEIMYVNAFILEQCIAEVNKGKIFEENSQNIWKLIKSANDGIENIPAENFKKLGYLLPTIPLEDLRNVSMQTVEIIEAFGSIHPTDFSTGFNAEQISIIAVKVRNEWLGKNPKTYSHYDLISMGYILCHFDTIDIEEIHADAFKEAVAFIGNIKNCPHNTLQAFAKLAMRPEAFGASNNWSKLEVTIVGNIINGLSPSEISQIDIDKLHLNRHYSKNQKVALKNVDNLKSTISDN